jgi:hypothetical protein
MPETTQFEPMTQPCTNATRLSTNNVCRRHTHAQNGIPISPDTFSDNTGEAESNEGRMRLDQPLAGEVVIVILVLLL